MMSAIRLAAVLALSAAWPGPVAADAGPRFEDYPAAAGPAGRGAPVRLADPLSRTFATRLRWAAAQPANFAGHHVLAAWGCGASCVTVAAIDRRTGQVAWLPFNVCCWPATAEPLEYHIGSRLLVVTGMRNETGTNGVRSYVLEGGRFRLQHDAAP